MAEDRNKLMQKAEKLVRQGKLEQAIAAYKEVMDDSPKDMNLKNKIGDLCVKAGLNDQAVEVFNDIADFYGREGFYLKAIAMLKKTSKLAPADTAGYLRLADLYSKQGLNNDAKSQYQQVAEVFASAGDHVKAADALEKATRLDPTNIKLQMRLADLFSKAGLEDKALASLQGVGDELARTGMFEEALKIYEKGLTAKAAHPGLATGVLRALTSIGRGREAVQRGANLAANSEDVGLLAALADACGKVGDLGRERELVERLIHLDPENKVWQERLGQGGAVATESRTRSGGGATIATASSQVPDFSEMSGDFTMEELEEVSGQWDGINLSSNDRLAAGGEASIGATEVEANSQKSEFIAEHMTEAEVFIKYGLVEKAIDNLEAIVSRYPDEAETLRRLKDLYLEAGNKAKAAERCVDLATFHRSRGDSAKAVAMLAEARAHHPSVQFDRTAPTVDPVVPAGRADEVEYSFGEVPVEMDSSPPSSGIELDFESPSDASLPLGYGSAPDAGGASGYEIGAGSSGTAARTEADGGIEFAYDTPSDGDHEAIDVSLDDSDGDPQVVGLEFDAPAVPLAVAPEPSEGDLSEVTFYLEQGFRDQARARLAALQSLYPNSKQVAEMLIGLDERPVPPSEEGIEFFEDAIQKPQREEDPFGIGDSGEQSLFDQENDFFATPIEAQSESSGASISKEFEDDSIEAIFQEFKKGVEDKVGSEDYETHYNLGIAYKEMGLTDEAIAEFQLSSKDPGKFIDACSNLGLCFREKGMPKLAIKWYDRALAKLDAGSVQYVAILYDMGQAFEESGDREKALEMYTDVYGLDAGFREVAEKLRMLGS